MHGERRDTTIRLETHMQDSLRKRKPAKKKAIKQGFAIQYSVERQMGLRPPRLRSAKSRKRGSKKKKSGPSR